MLKTVPFTTEESSKYSPVDFERPEVVSKLRNMTDALDLAEVEAPSFALPHNMPTGYHHMN